MWSYLVMPFGYIMRFCYNLFENYGVALFLYAIITKFVLIPLSIKQQKTQLSLIKLKPYQDELMKKYGGNRQRYQEELMRLYEREGYSPTASCLPTFIQLPIIMLIYTIVRRPLTYLAGMSLKEMWPKMQEMIASVSARITDTMTAAGATTEEIAAKVGEFTGTFSKMTTENFHQYELQALPHMIEEGMVDIKTKFLGIFDLAKTPNQFLEDGWFQGAFWLILIPILAGATSFLVSWISQKLNPSSMDQQAQGGCSMKTMMYVMPLISVFISYGYNAALGVYWIASNIVAIAQTFILHHFYNPQKVLAEVEEKMKREKEAEKEKRRLAAERRALSNNKNSKKKRAINAQNAAKLSEAKKENGDTDTEKGE